MYPKFLKKHELTDELDAFAFQAGRAEQVSQFEAQTDKAACDAALTEKGADFIHVV